MIQTTNEPKGNAAAVAKANSAAQREILQALQANQGSMPQGRVALHVLSAARARKKGLTYEVLQAALLALIRERRVRLNENLLLTLP